MTLLEVSDLGKRFPEGSRELCVLENVSLEIFTDDFVGLWGTRGSGKSTLLRILLGIEVPDCGSVRFDDVELTALAPDARARILRNKVGLASFDSPTHRNRSVCQHVALAASADPLVTGRKARVMARRALHRVEVVDCAERPLDRLSSAERVRVELARAIVREPDLLMIDDPPSLQSPLENHALHELLNSLGTESGRAVLIAACELESLKGAERMMALGLGRLRTMDNPGTVVPFPDRTGTAGP